MRIRNRSTHLSSFSSPIFPTEEGERVVQLKEAEDSTSLEEAKKKKKERADPNCDAPPRLLLPDSPTPATGSLPIRQKTNAESATTTTFRGSPTEEVGQKVEKREGAREEGEDRFRQRFEAPNEHYSQENSDFPLKRRRNLEWASDDDDNYGDDDSDEEYNIQKKKKKGKMVEKKWMCTRMNGRGWRCSKPTLVGYSLCEHHLGKGRRIKTINTLAPEKQKDDNSEVSIRNSKRKDKEIMITG